MPCSNDAPSDDGGIISNQLMLFAKANSETSKDERHNSAFRRLLQSVTFYAFVLPISTIALAVISVIFGPYVYWVTHSWRYKIPKEEIEKYIILFRKIIAYVRGSMQIKSPDRIDIFFAHIFTNIFLRRYYKSLKKRHHHEPQLSSEALRVFKAIAPIIASNGPELRPFLNELRYSDQERYLNHDMSYFKECRGDIFTPTMEFFVEVILTTKREVIEILKTTYEETAVAVAKVMPMTNWKKDRVEDILSITKGIIDLSEDMPDVLMLGMAFHADVLTRWSLFEGDGEAANNAIRAGQRMKTLRSLRQEGKVNHAFRKALHEYFEFIADAGAALYGHLETPRRLTQSLIALPPTKEEAAEARKIANLESRAASLERENAEIKQELDETKQKIKDILRGDQAGQPMSNETESTFIDKAVAKSTRGRRTEWLDARDAVVEWLMEQLALLVLLNDKTGKEFYNALKDNSKVNYIAKAAYSKVRDYTHKTKEEREKGFREATVGDIIDCKGKKIAKGGEAAEKVDENAHLLYLAASQEWWFFRLDDAVAHAPRPLINGQGEWKVGAGELCRLIKNEVDKNAKAA